MSDQDLPEGFRPRRHPAHLRAEQASRERRLVRDILFPSFRAPTPKILEADSTPQSPDLSKQRLTSGQIADGLYQQSILFMVRAGQKNMPGADADEVFRSLETRFIEAIRAHHGASAGKRGRRPVSVAVHARLTQLLRSISTDSVDSHVDWGETLDRSLLYVSLHQVLECALGSPEIAAESHGESDEDDNDWADYEATDAQDVVADVAGADTVAAGIALDISRTELCSRIWRVIGLEVNACLARDPDSGYRVPGLRQQRLGTDRTLRQFEERAGISRLDGLKFAATVLQILSYFTEQHLFRFQNGLGKRILKLVICQGLIDMLQQRRSQRTVVPINAPMLVEPLPWRVDQGTSQGGYLTRFLPYVKMPVKNERLRQFVRVVNGRTSKDSSGQVESCPSLTLPFEATNLCQQTAWRINLDVYRVYQSLSTWRDALRKRTRRTPKGGERLLPAAATVGLFDRQMANAMAGLSGPEPDLNVPVSWIDWLLSEAFEIQIDGGGKSGQGPAGRVGSPFSALLLEDCVLRRNGFFFPYQADFRGRIYPVGGIIKPDGEDLARALLEFADAKPIGSMAAVKMLQRHGAGLVPASTIAEHFGIDRAALTLRHREQWVDAHSARIQASAAAPLDEIWWREIAPDDPFKFLAFCFAWAEYLQRGLDAELNLPVMVDGTCNGLQHIAVLANDQALAAATNVIPTVAPSGVVLRDIYGEIGRLTAERLVEHGATLKFRGEDKGPSKELQAFVRRHASVLISRAVAKAVVMVIPYGAGLSAFAKRCTVVLVKSCLVAEGRPMRQSAILPWVLPELERDLLLTVPSLVSSDGPAPELGRKQFTRMLHKALAPAGWWIAAEIEKTLAGCFPGLGAFKKRLRRMTDPVVAANIPLMWVAPNGMGIVQPKFQRDERNLDLLLQHTDGLNKRLRVTLQTMTEDIAAVGQKKGILPNLVHALDAAHLHMTIVATRHAVLAALDEGKRATCMPAFAVIHDSFGTHAADAPVLASCLREQFVNLYSTPQASIGYLSRWFDLLATARLTSPALADGDITETMPPAAQILDPIDRLGWRILELACQWRAEPGDEVPRDHEGELALAIADLPSTADRPPDWLHEVIDSPGFFC